MKALVNSVLGNQEVFVSEMLKAIALLFIFYTIAIFGIIMWG